MRFSGYELGNESQRLLKIAQRIEEAEDQRKESEQRKREFINKNLGDSFQEAESIDIILSLLPGEDKPQLVVRSGCYALCWV